MQGKWVTINGTHIFIKDGQTVEEAFAERDAFRKDYVDKLVKHVKYVQAKPYIRYYDKDDKRIMPKKVFSDRLRRALEKYEIDDAILGNVLFKCDELILKDTFGSDVSIGWAVGQPIVRMHISVDGNSSEIAHRFNHEAGHIIDMLDRSQWMSSTYISKKHGTTMSEMFAQEAPDKDFWIDEYKRLDDEIDKLDRESKDYLLKRNDLEEEQTNLVDMF